MECSASSSDDTLATLGAEMESFIEASYPLSCSARDNERPQCDVREKAAEEKTTIGQEQGSAATSNEEKSVSSTTTGIVEFSSGFEHAKYLAQYGREDAFSGIQDIFNCIYGEVPISTFYSILEILKPREGDIFFDLGSGRGQVVLAAAYMHPFSKVVGIELLEPLYDLSTKAIEACLSSSVFERKAAEVKVVCGDILHEEAYPLYSWSGTGINSNKGDKTGQTTAKDVKRKKQPKVFGQADIVFALSTAFGEDLMKGISERAENLKVGAKIVTSSNKILSPLYRIIWEGKLPMTWGDATVYIQEKVHNRRLESVILKSFFRKK